MSLADFEPERATVKLPKGKSFSVRGLTVDDISVLARTHFQDLAKLAEIYRAVRTDIFARLADQAFALKVINEAPAVASNAIALAADEPENAHKVRMMPLPIVLAAWMEIARLTFEDFGGPKAFLAVLEDIFSKEALTGATADPARTS